MAGAVMAGEGAAARMPLYHLRRVASGPCSGLQHGVMELPDYFARNLYLSCSREEFMLSLSRNHAAIICHPPQGDWGPQYCVVDKSLHGTYINGIRLPLGQMVWLHENDMICFGALHALNPFVFVFERCTCPSHKPRTSPPAPCRMLVETFISDQIPASTSPSASPSALQSSLATPAHSPFPVAASSAPQEQKQDQEYELRREDGMDDGGRKADELAPQAEQMAEPQSGREEPAERKENESEEHAEHAPLEAGDVKEDDDMELQHADYATKTVTQADGEPQSNGGQIAQPPERQADAQIGASAGATGATGAALTAVTTEAQVQQHGGRESEAECKQEKDDGGAQAMLTETEPNRSGDAGEDRRTEAQNGKDAVPVAAAGAAAAAAVVPAESQEEAEDVGRKKAKKSATDEAKAEESTKPERRKEKHKEKERKEEKKRKNRRKNKEGHHKKSPPEERAMEQDALAAALLAAAAAPGRGRKASATKWKDADPSMGNGRKEDKANKRKKSTTDEESGVTTGNDDSGRHAKRARERLAPEETGESKAAAKEAKKMTNINGDNSDNNEQKSLEEQQRQQQKQQEKEGGGDKKEEKQEEKKEEEGEAEETEKEEEEEEEKSKKSKKNNDRSEAEQSELYEHVGDDDPAPPQPLHGIDEQRHAEWLKSLRPGEYVEALWQDGLWYRARVTRKHKALEFSVKYLCDNVVERIGGNIMRPTGTATHDRGDLQ